MELALHIWNFHPPDDPGALGRTFTATAKAADQGGFSTITLMDHFFQMEAAAPASGCCVGSAWWSAPTA